jgi:hypothetical protein
VYRNKNILLVLKIIENNEIVIILFLLCDVKSFLLCCFFLGHNDSLMHNKLIVCFPANTLMPSKGSMRECSIRINNIPS